MRTPTRIPTADIFFLENCSIKPWSVYYSPSDHRNKAILLTYQKYLAQCIKTKVLVLLLKYLLHWYRNKINFFKNQFEYESLEGVLYFSESAISLCKYSVLWDIKLNAIEYMHWRHLRLSNTAISDMWKIIF